MKKRSCAIRRMEILGLALAAALAVPGVARADQAGSSQAAAIFASEEGTKSSQGEQGADRGSAGEGNTLAAEPESETFSSDAGEASEAGSETEDVAGTPSELAPDEAEHEAVRAAVSASEKVKYTSKDDSFYRGGKKLTNQWVELYGKRYFADANGHPYRNRFITFGSGVAYYMGSTGIMQTGFVEIQGNLYYFEESGSKAGRLAMSNRWTQTPKGEVFPNAEGVIYRDRFLTFGPKISVYVDENGVRAHGPRMIDGAMVDLDSHGQLIKKAHRYDVNGKRYYAKSDGMPYRSQWLSFGQEHWRLAGKDGSIQKGIVPFDGTVYRLDEKSGDLVRKSSAYSYNGKNYFSRPNGMPYRNQVLTFGPNKAIYMGADGSQQYGLIDAGDEAYYADVKSGNLLRNAGLFSVSGKVYYSDRSYALAKGWVNRGGHSYYFDPSADLPARVEDAIRTIGGITYQFDENGDATRIAVASEPGEWTYAGGYLSGPAVTDQYVGSRVVIVSLRHQYMTIISDGEVALQTAIISGKPKTPTVRGNFSVQYMERDTYLKGPTWNSHVEYWVPFYGGYGIHDAPWQSSYNFYRDSGANTWVGSHGCVNVPSSVMPRVYQLLYTGTPVIVY